MMTLKQAEILISDEPAAAIVSQCGQYRYALSRHWGHATFKPLIFIMLNPSTADGKQDDPTVRKCCGFARRLGHSGVIVVNLFAFRATDPDDLRRAIDPVGPGNEDWLSLTATTARDEGFSLVCAWGRHGNYQGAGDVCRRWLSGHDVPYLTFGITKNGQPPHPLMLPYSTKLRPPEPRRKVA